MLYEKFSDEVRPLLENRKLYERPFGHSGAFLVISVEMSTNNFDFNINTKEDFAVPVVNLKPSVDEITTTMKNHLD